MASPASPPYIELHCHSNFSLLDGASPPEALAARAAELGLPALALTDHDALYGAVRFAQAAHDHGIQPIFGAELTLADGHHLTLLVENEPGWGNLCHLISLARQAAPKGQAALPLPALANHTEGLIALSGCKQGPVAGHLLRHDREAALAAARDLRDLFGPARCWIELQHHLLPEDDRLLAALVGLARQVGLGYVATNNVHYAQRAGYRLQDVLVCIRHQTTLDEAGPLLRPNSEFYLKSGRQLAPLLASYPEALTNTLRLAERCQFELAYGLQDLPQFPTPPNLTALTHLQHLCRQAIRRKYPDPPARLHDQLAYELQVVAQAGLANYFLIVWDIVHYARRQGIRCQGRGSAANSLLAYLLDISPIDPLAHDLVFERFLSPERQVTPDIDLDFDAGRREEVIQYVYARYGPAHTAMACTFVTYRTRSAWRDVGQALGLSPQIVAAVRQETETQPAPPAAASDQAPLALLHDLCAQIQGFPRHLGIHNGGMLITASPLAQRVPAEPAAMPGRVVVQWDKEALEAVGLVKIDLLGLRMLSAIAETVERVERLTGQAPDLDRLSFDDPAVYELIAAADTLGVFQVESRAQAQMLPRLRPRCFQDLIVAISLIRPGPIQGNMVHPYLRRRLGLEPVSYLHPRLEPALRDTLGVILFQEDVLKVARDLAGFTPGQGEQLRRALGAKEAQAKIDRFQQLFIAGAQARGVPVEIAEQVFSQLRAFAGYAFAKSHAAAFAVLVYQSAWLKHYHFAPFYVSLLNNQPMGFWPPSVLVNEARRHGVQVLPVHLGRSQARCTVEGAGIRLGFTYVKGLGAAQIERLLACRAESPFTALADFCRRTHLSRRLVTNLIGAGAMDHWGLPRRRLLWELGQLDYQAGQLDLEFPLAALSLPPLDPAEAMLWEQQALGLSTGEQLMSRYRPWLAQQGILDSRQLAACAHGQPVRVAGLVVVRQSPPTANGVLFITLEDEDGLINIIVRPSLYQRERRLWRTEPVLLVQGVVQKRDSVVSVLASHAVALPR